MCRLVGVVASESTDFRFTLHDAPRSLAALSPEHPHGWGLAVHARDRGWELHKEPACARDDARFRSVAAEARGEVLIGHVRKRTVGPIGPVNTHPFRRGAWVFAHNGTIEDTAWLATRASAARRAEIEGETDSELFFAALLTAIDEAGGAEGAGAAAEGAVDRAIGAFLALSYARPSFGASNFLLCDGRALFAHRSGRTLFVLTRGRGDRVIDSRRSRETQAVVETRWSDRREAVLVASESMTDEPWSELAERTLLRIDAGARPTMRVISGGRVSERPASAAPTT